MCIHTNRRRGQTLVELALVLPIVILLVLGLIEFGRALFLYTVVSNAAREGVRRGIVAPTDSAGIRQAAERTLVLVPTDTVSINITCDTGLDNQTIDCTDPTVSPGKSRVVVQVSIPFSMITPLIRDIFPPTTISFKSARTIEPGARVRKTPAPPPFSFDYGVIGVSLSGPVSGNTSGTYGSACP